MMDYDAYLLSIRTVLTAAHDEAAREGSTLLSSAHVAQAILGLQAARRCLIGPNLAEFDRRRAAAVPKFGLGESQTGGEIVVAPIVRQALESQAAKESSNAGPLRYLELLGWILAHDASLAATLTIEGLDADEVRRSIDLATAT